MVYFLRSRSSRGHNQAIHPIRSEASFDFRRLLCDSLELETKKFEEGETVELEEVKSNADEEHAAPPPTAAPKRRFDDTFEPVHLNRSHRRRAAKRTAKTVAEGQVPKPALLGDLLASSEPLQTHLRPAELPATSCGYQALNFNYEKRHSEGENLEALLAEGYEYHEWDASNPRPLLTAKDVVFGACTGGPSDGCYSMACDRLYDKLTEFGQAADVQAEADGNRRGPFPVLNVGVTHGKGTTTPVRLHSEKNGKASKHSEKVKELLDDDDLNRVATFQSAAFATWAPKLYTYYKTQLDKLYAHSPHLQPQFKKSVFACAAINCGPNVWTRRHRDSMNLPFGLCAITALGKFNHKLGGHLVLPDLKMIIEFPAGSTILIPSATLVHANIPVQSGECRASFTQFCAGGLFRFVDNGFMTEKDLKKKNKKAHAEVIALKANRWEMGLGLFSHMDELAEYAESENA